MRRVLVAAILIGLFAFLGGFYVGPRFLCVDDCPSAPLNGIFTSGPLGLLIGAIVGLLAWLRRWPSPRFFVVVGVTSVVALAGGTCLSWPEPFLESRLIEGEVVRCGAPVDLSSAARTRWRGYIADSPWMRPRDGWEADIGRLLQADPGVVLTIHLRGRKDFYRRREPWHYGLISTAGWKRDTKTDQFFARFSGGACSSYQLGQTLDFKLDWEASTVSPPDILPAFLGLYVVNPVPKVWRPVQRPPN
jgi:hypothetical protein